jgi:hypothetical protein
VTELESLAQELVAYAMAEPCDRIGMVCVPDFRFIEADIGRDRARLEGILVALATIYSLRRELENA